MSTTYDVSEAREQFEKVYAQSPSKAQTCGSGEVGAYSNAISARCPAPMLPWRVRQERDPCPGAPGLPPEGRSGSHRKLYAALVGFRTVKSFRFRTCNISVAEVYHTHQHKDLCKTLTKLEVSCIMVQSVHALCFP